MDILHRIKRLVIIGRLKFTDKAYSEMLQDGLDTGDVAESIVSATFVRGKLSTSVAKRHAREKAWIIEGFTFKGVCIYIKGMIRKFEEQEHFYVLISAKRSTIGSAG